MTHQPLTIRRAMSEDAPVIAAHRRLMFEAMGVGTAAELDQMASAAIPWLRMRLAREEYLGWLAVTPGGFAASGAGLWVRDYPPNPRDMSGQRGYIFNVYTYPEFRRQGLARLLVDQALDWCSACGINAVTLHYSEEGRSIYEAMGFKVNNEMVLWLRDRVRRES